MNFVSRVTLSGEIFSSFYVKKGKYLGLEHHTWKPWSNFAHIHWETNSWEHKSINNTAIIERKIALTRGHYLIPVSAHLSFFNISRGQACCMDSSIHQYCIARRRTRDSKAKGEWEESSSGAVCGLQRTPGEGTQDGPTTLCTHKWCHDQNQTSLTGGMGGLSSLWPPFWMSQIESKTKESEFHRFIE